MRKLRNDYSPTTHELQKDYSCITVGNYNVLHHFYDYVYGVLRHSMLTFFGPYRILVLNTMSPYQHFIQFFMAY